LVGDDGRMQLQEVMRQRRAEVGMSQSDLAQAVGVDVEQIRRYEAGEEQPMLTVGMGIADTLGISVSELVGKPAHRVRLSGRWWAAWQTYRDGAEKIAIQEAEIKQEGDRLQVSTISRGLSPEEGGYHWSGELRLWDNEILMGWYAAKEGSVRSKGTMYFVLHPHGVHMSGRWVGLGYDERIMTGWATMGQTQEEAEKAMTRLMEARSASPEMRESAGLA
jgi:DNA-binding XRE family transcriptional regulator